MPYPAFRRNKPFETMIANGNFPKLMSEVSLSHSHIVYEIIGLKVKSLKKFVVVKYIKQNTRLSVKSMDF